MNLSTVLAAYNASQETNYLDLDHPASIAALVDYETPESAFIRKRTEEELSTDARYVLSHLYHITDILANSQGKITRDTLQRYLRGQWMWSAKRTERAMKEILQYYRHLEAGIV
jgi:hypothetical protein